MKCTKHIEDEYVFREGFVTIYLKLKSSTIFYEGYFNIVSQLQGSLLE